MYSRIFLTFLKFFFTFGFLSEAKEDPERTPAQRLLRRAQQLPEDPATGSQQGEGVCGQSPSQLQGVGEKPACARPHTHTEAGNPLQCLHLVLTGGTTWGQLWRNASVCEVAPLLAFLIHGGFFRYRVPSPDSPPQRISVAGSGGGHHWGRPEADPGAGVSHPAAGGADESQVRGRGPRVRRRSHQTSVCLSPQSDITVINDIFKDLGMMVHEQGDMIGEKVHVPVVKVRGSARRPSDRLSFLPQRWKSAWTNEDKRSSLLD